MARPCSLTFLGNVNPASLPGRKPFFVHTCRRRTRDKHRDIGTWIFRVYSLLHTGVLCSFRISSVQLMPIDHHGQISYSPKIFVVCTRGGILKVSRKPRACECPYYRCICLTVLPGMSILRTAQSANVSRRGEPFFLFPFPPIEQLEYGYQPQA